MLISIVDIDIEELNGVMFFNVIFSDGSSWRQVIPEWAFGNTLTTMKSLESKVSGEFFVTLNFVSGDIYTFVAKHMKTVRDRDRISPIVDMYEVIKND